MEAAAKRQACAKATADAAARVGPIAALCVTHMRQSGQCYHRRNTRTHNCHALYQNTPAFAPPVDQPVAVSTRTAWQTQRGSHSSISRRIEWTNDRTEYVPPL